MEVTESRQTWAMSFIKYEYKKRFNFVNTT